MKKFYCLFISLFFVFFVAAGSASATMSGWDLNASLLNTLPGLSGYTDATNLDHINVSGTAMVTQNYANGSPNNQTFTESGFLQFDSYITVAAQGSTNFHNPPYIYIAYKDLTGTFHGTGTSSSDFITFDTPQTVFLYASQDSTFDGFSAPVPADTLIATYTLEFPSAGSNTQFFGGANPNATIDTTLKLASVFNANFFTSGGGNALDPNLTLHLVDVQSLLNPLVNPNPDTSGIDGNGNGSATVFVRNNGTYYLQTVPEPNTLMLLGLGMIGIAGIARKRAAKK
jgi:hypothetical protein